MAVAVAERSPWLIPMSDQEVELVGEVGYVTTRVGGGDRPGEVQISYRGGSESFIAYGDEPIERGHQVMVIGRRPGRCLDVMALSG